MNILVGRSADRIYALPEQYFEKKSALYVSLERNHLLPILRVTFGDKKTCHQKLSNKVEKYKLHASCPIRYK